MTDALEDYKGTVSIHEHRRQNNHQLTLAGKEEVLASPVDRLGKTSSAFDMEIRAEKTKLTTNNTGCIEENWTRLTVLSIWAQSSQTKVPNLKYCPELYRQQQY